MKKLLIIFSVGILLLSIITGCNRDRFSEEPVDNEIKEFQGVIEKKGWSKSAESYCAQGSDYFVLDVGDEEIILKTSNRFEDHIDKNVSVKGRFLRREIPCPENQQCLMGVDGEPYICEVFEVTEFQ